MFPVTKYNLDDISSVQVVTNISTRCALSTPEILADKFYNDPQLHWIILHANEIHDARFDWPLTVPNLVSYVEAKYPSREAIHHYEDDNEVVVTGNVYINSTNAFSQMSADDVIINNTSDGIGVIVSKISNANVVVNVSFGGFRASDNIELFSNANVTANISSTTAINCTPITSFVYEDRLNEDRRNIRILKTQYIEAVVREFETKMSV